MMSAARHQSLLSGVNNLARKVYEAVPHSERWDSKQICTALVRMSTPMGLDAVQGCLDILTRSGLIKESKEGFVRVPVRQKKSLADLPEVLKNSHPEGIAQQVANLSPPPPPEPKKAPMTAPALKVIQPNIVDIIGDLSQQVAAMAQRHQQEMATLAGLIADAAIDVQHELEEKEKSLAQWRQMQALLKGMAA